MRKDSGGRAGGRRKKIPASVEGSRKARRGWRARAERGEEEEGREPKSERARASDTPLRES